jgi:hypothetical protein
MDHVAAKAKPEPANARNATRSRVATSFRNFLAPHTHELRRVFLCGTLSLLQKTQGYIGGSSETAAQPRRNFVLLTDCLRGAC